MRAIEQAPDWFGLRTQVTEHMFGDNYEKLVQQLNNPYLYWDKIKYKKTNLSISAKELWAIAKLSRLHGEKIVSFGPYTFSFNNTDSIQKALHEFDMNIGGNLGSKNIIPSEDKKRYLVSSIMEEAIASSQIEGAVTTRKKAKEMLRKKARPRNRSEQMIVNNYETIRHIAAIKHKPLTIEGLLEVHRLITSQTLDDGNDEGIFRDNNEINVVDSVDGEIVHTPPSFEEVPGLMNDLIRFFNHADEDKFIHPIIKGCIVHFMIGYIHPFVDGNGRTARALFYWFLLKNGYWLTEYLSISRLIVKRKNQYAMAFLYTETDENDLTYFIDYKIKTMQLAFEELRNYIARKIKEKKEVTAFQKISGINERQAILLKLLHDEPDLLLNVKEVEVRLNISNQTARTDLQGLVNMGFLEQTDLNKKSKGFYRSDNFHLLVQSAAAKK